jgi:uncharacterized membrane protein
LERLIINNPYGREGESMTEEYQRVFNGEYGSYLEHPQGENDKVLAGLCYIFGWILSLVVILAIKPCSPYLRFHALQALGLHLVNMIVGTVLSFALVFAMVFFCLLPIIMALLFVIPTYTLVVGILILLDNDHRTPLLGDYIEENFV